MIPKINHAQISKLNIIAFAQNGKCIDVRNLLLKLDIQESIFSPSIHGTVTLNDSLDLPYYLAFTGHEFIEIEFTGKYSAQPFYFFGKIITCDNTRYEKDRQQTYTLSFTSVEHYISERLKFSRAYKDQTIHDIFKDIWERTYNDKDQYINNFLPMSWEKKRDDKTGSPITRGRYEVGKIFPMRSNDPTNPVVDFFRGIFDTLDVNTLKDEQKKHWLVEQTDPARKYSVALPYGTPFRQFSFLASRAIGEPLQSNGNTGNTGVSTLPNDFLFFENKFGLNFTSISKLFANASVNFGNPYEYMWQSVEGDVSGRIFTIFDITPLESYNVLESVSGGLKSSLMVYFDLLTKQFIERHHCYLDEFSKKNHVVTVEPQPLLLDFEGNTVNISTNARKTPRNTQQFESCRRYYPLHFKNYDENSDISQETFKSLDSYAHEIYLQRNSRLQEISSIAFNIRVNGNSALTAGAKIRVNINAFKPIERKGLPFEEIYNKYLSGDFLITDISHTLNRNGEYTNSMTVCKDALEKKIAEPQVQEGALFSNLVDRLLDRV